MGNVKSSFLSIIFGLKSMTVGKGIRLAIFYICQNQMKKGSELNCLFILVWEI